MLLWMAATITIYLIIGIAIGFVFAKGLKNNICDLSLGCIVLLWPAVILGGVVLAIALGLAIIIGSIPELFGKLCKKIAGVM